MMMCRYACFLIFFFSFTLAFAQQKVRDNTVQSGVILPNTDALLELESTNKGLLHTRVALVQTTEASPLAAHVAGMMVYNTATANDVIPGIYYNNGSRWVLAAAGQASTITYDPVRHQIAYVDAAGITQIIDLKQVVKQHETVTGLRDNGDRTVTFTNELGEAETVDLSPYFQAAGDITYDGAHSGLTGPSVQLAIDELAAKETAVTGSDHVVVTSTTLGGKTEYTVAVAVANGASPGVVKEAAENPTVMISNNGELTVNTGNLNPVREVMASYTATPNDAILLGNAIGGPLTITLPIPTDANKGKKYTIKKQDGNEDTHVNVAGIIEGDITLYTALPYSGWDLVSDGTTWKIVNKF